MILNLVAVRFQGFGEFVIIHILHEFLGLEHFKIVHRLPTAFLVVVGGVEHNAMRMQMRVQSARRVMPKCRGDNIARQAVADLAGLVDTSGGELF